MGSTLGIVDSLSLINCTMGRCVVSAEQALPSIWLSMLQKQKPDSWNWQNAWLVSMPIWSIAAYKNCLVPQGKNSRYWTPSSQLQKRTQGIEPVKVPSPASTFRPFSGAYSKNKLVPSAP